MAEQYLGHIQEQRMEQSLTPQMLQSLKILQAPILDLQTMIREEMDQNPTLEREAPEVEQTTDFDAAAREELREEREIGELTELAEWDADFRSNREVRSQSDDEQHQFMMDSIEGAASLQEHLLEQLALAGLDARERGIAEVLIGSIDDDGYLQLDLDGIIGSTPEFPEELFERIIKVIQGFDPVGVGARDLKECLLLQLRHKGRENSLEAVLVRDHLDKLGAHQYEQIARAMRLPIEKIKELSAAVADLDPKPGRNFTADKTEYIIPEITVEKKGGIWTVTQNKSPYPRLFISQKYLELLKDKTTAADTRRYIREKIAKSKFFIRSIDQRQDTIYRLACEIVRVQEDFLEEGVSGLKPLTMKQVADILEVHETTVSRACSGKYMATPQGTFEFKYFFTTGVVQADGRILSNASIKSALASIVRTESSRRPLSDQRIADELSKQGIDIARRTVAKYREQLKILP
ncbi:MAG TPA: RNA polymerase factor sigma-54, partial [Pontiellaceae bacterium]|nr:RNA polymerase factor sigma-54 [Pontiellaceae bacterium]HPR83482.1 RNA polymerase factor sigma-54 [Pontiellaceae bacterium]